MAQSPKAPQGRCHFLLGPPIKVILGALCHLGGLYNSFLVWFWNAVLRSWISRTEPHQAPFGAPEAAIEVGDVRCAWRRAVLEEQCRRDALTSTSVSLFLCPEHVGKGVERGA